jgi:hypothetical protein
MHNYLVFKCPWYIDLKEKKIILINQIKTIFISSLFFHAQILYCVEVYTRWDTTT